MDRDFFSKIYKDIGIVGENDDLRVYAVTIPLVNINGEENIVFEIRSRNLSGAGEISLPGGKVEKYERKIDAAIRETCEELLLKEDNIEILSFADTAVTHYGKVIYTFIARIKDANKINFSKDEVEKIIFIPLDFFIKTKPQVMKIKTTTNPLEEFPYDIGVTSKNYKWESTKLNVYFYKYENYVIWGLTAKIIHSFIDRIIFKDK
ncbi:ADP-ribose pyrophosphatase YjhB, NUDIX family [Caloramator quimbayensis]|uniref:ADP-ribose pyrophosphatase YjhB, NUDIX family n=1 Tax=Caloramator quimbayensis TaxID=1147123 RepID=A0A1T4Y7I5_9CLOT|nr:CoA pyrophosphatase [Caloramator quimbayensis]SKA97680.1 ADP-ribose pyrophosphatase YjhB, NUDIX family [Caloramator quimbayensis]